MENKVIAGSLFESFIADVFSAYGYKIKREGSFPLSNEKPSKPRMQYRSDIVAYNRGQEFYIEVKYYRQKEVSLQNVQNAIDVMRRNNVGRSILVINSIAIDKQYLKTNDIIIIDLPVLLSLVYKNDNLYFKLLNLLDFSITDVKIESSDIIQSLFEIDQQDHTFPSKNIEQKDEKTQNKEGKVLIQRLRDLKKTNHSFKDYEELCTKVLKYLFSEDLRLWNTQQTSNANLFRFDLICKIKDDVSNGFWKFLLDFFKSKFIIFEFKYYSNEITQKEIFTTEKYLYTKAFRSVGFILSCKGCDKNSLTAAKGVLRENGKLIVVLSNSDLIKMIRDKMNGNSETEVLSNKLDKMLIELEK